MSCLTSIRKLTLDQGSPGFDAQEHFHCPSESLCWKFTQSLQMISAQAVQNTWEFSHRYSKKTAQCAQGQGD